jgi:hypothetical protein
MFVLDMFLNTLFFFEIKKKTKYSKYSIKYKIISQERGSERLLGEIHHFLYILNIFIFKIHLAPVPWPCRFQSFVMHLPQSLVSRPQCHGPSATWPQCHLASVGPSAIAPFESEGHVYHVRGKQTKGSVTGLIHACTQPFDADRAICNMMAGDRWPRSG